MDGQLKAGAALQSNSGINYRIKTLLGAGGQGEVYDVEAGGKHYALKWYFPKMATQAQKKILEHLIAQGSPDACFLWPQDMIADDAKRSFGYIMPLRPRNYKGIVDMMKRQAEPSFETLCRAAYNMTCGYQKLHTMGYSYRDISFGNLFFDPDTGDVLICDNDNVSASGIDNSSVYGTPRFMAPEIVVGKAAPSRNTDVYSLAVLLFYIFMVGHPLEGKLEASVKCMDVPAMNKLYGTDPVFIFDPRNDSNRPVPGYQDNPRIYWEIYPQELKELFITSFTVGLRDPDQRVTERQWMQVLSNMMSGITVCPRCGAEAFFDAEKEASGAGCRCWNCGRKVPMPASLLVDGRRRVLLSNGRKICAHHTLGNYDMDTIVGEVVQNPKDPSVLGIKNKSSEVWTYIRADGSQVPVAIGKSAAITAGAKLNFGQSVGEFL